MNLIFDTHAHYDDEAFDADRDTLLASMPENGVGLIVDPGCDLDTSRRAVEIAEQYPHVYAAVGWHPENCAPYTRASLDTLRAWAKSPKVVAIGEIGLDYHYGFSEKDVQKRFFEAQMQLAEELDMPVIIHDREAHSDVFETVKAHPRVRGVMHSYSGSAEMAREYIKLGWYLSFSGVVTFTNAAKTHEAAKATPLDRLLIETDAPYLAPVPMRGKTNHSGYIHYTAEKIAELHGIDVDTVARITAENARKLFRISE